MRSAILGKDAASAEQQTKNQDTMSFCRLKKKNNVCDPGLTIEAKVACVNDGFRIVFRCELVQQRQLACSHKHVSTAIQTAHGYQVS